MKGLIILGLVVVVVIVGVVGFLLSGGNANNSETSSSDNLAEQLYASGEYEQAFDEVSKEIEREPDDASQYILLGKIQYKQGKFEEAIAAFNQAIEFDENVAEAYAYRARSYLIFEKNPDKARTDNNTALSLDPTQALAYVTEADLALMSGDTVKAGRSYSEAIQQDPTLTEAFISRGEFLFSNGYYDQAKADFDKAISLDGENAATLARRAHANYYLEMFGPSHQDALRAAELDSDSALAFAVLGLLEINEGNFEAALSYLSLALEKNPEQIYTYIYRGRYFEAIEDIDAAFADFNQAIDRGPMLALAYLYRGNAYRARGDIDRAVDDYTASIARAENSPMAHFNRAEAYRAKRDFAAALEDYGATIARTSNFTEAYLARAEIYFFEQQNYVGAIEDLTTVISLEPTAYVYRLRSLAYAGLGQRQQARLDRDTAVEMEIDKPSIIGDGYDIQINRIWSAKEAAGVTAQNGQFLVIELGLYNYSNEKICLLKSDFEAVVGGREIEPERMYQIEQAFFGGNRSYPPTENSTCLNETRLWDTFVSYDVSEDISSIAINFTPERVTINFELWLMPEADSEYQFAIAEINGTRQIEFGELIYLEETLEQVIAVEPLELDNCNSDAERTTIINLTREEFREVGVETVQGIDGVSAGVKQAEVSVGIRYLQTESEAESSRVTYQREESFTIPPRSIANYEIVWSRVSKQGELEVIQGAQTYTVPFTITDALKVDVRSRPSTPCETTE